MLEKKGQLSQKRLLLIFFVLILLTGGILWISFYYYQSPQDREKEAIQQGKMKMLGGQITEIDLEQNKFVININPLGQAQEYVININQETKIESWSYPSQEQAEPAMVGGFPVFEDGPPKPASPERTDISFSELKNGMQVEVRFFERINVNQEKSLIAQSVFVINQ